MIATAATSARLVSRHRALPYCEGDTIALIQRLPERIRNVHLKQVDPQVRRHVHEENLSLAEAVPRGVVCEPPYGEAATSPLLGPVRRRPS